MPTIKRTDFEEGHGFCKEDWDAVDDNPEWTEPDFEQAQPFIKIFLGLVEGPRRLRGRPKADAPRCRNCCFAFKRRSEMIACCIR